MGEQHWDRILAIAFFTLTGMFAVIGWLFKGKLKAFDKHIEECNQKAVETGKMQEKLSSLEVQADRSRITLDWIGDCLITIGAKQELKLPERPKV